MEGLVNEIKVIYKYFNGENYLYFSLFIFSVIYIFLKEKDKNIKSFFVGYTAIVLLVIWNPFCIYILNKFINIGSMYRIYYMLPLIITIAYVFAKILETEKTFKKFFVFFLICCCIVLFGRCIFNEYSLRKVDNYYKLPDEDVKIAKIIANDKETTYKKAMVPYGMSSKIRQIEPQIIMAYTRIVYNPTDENGNASPFDSDDASNYEPVKKMNEGDVEYIIDYCNKNKINYLVINKATLLTENILEKGFLLLDETENYYIYRAE